MCNYTCNVAQGNDQVLVPTQSQNAHIVNVSHCLELYLISEVRAGYSNYQYDCSIHTWK